MLGCVDGCMCACMYVCTPTHLHHSAFFYDYHFRIGTIVVVHKRAVTERQNRVRLVVCVNIIAKRQGPRQVVRHKKCPATHYYIIFLESAPCKNSETSCLESKRKFDGVQLTRNKQSALFKLNLQVNITDITK